MNQQRPRPETRGNKAGCGCLALLAFAVLGGIGVAMGDDEDTDPAASEPSCPTVKVVGLPTEKKGISVAEAGKHRCDGEDTVIPVTVTNGSEQDLTVSLTVQVTGSEGGSDRSSVLAYEELAPGEQVKGRAEVYVWGDLADSKTLTARVEEFTVAEPEPEPTETSDVDVPDGDVDRPDKCNRKWYC